MEQNENEEEEEEEEGMIVEKEEVVDKSLCQICKNGMIYEKGEKFDKDYKTKFEETFLNSL